MTCPLCASPMNPLRDLTDPTRITAYICTGPRCPHLVRVEELEGRSGLAQIRELMRPPISTTGEGGGGGSHNRRDEKPGAREARLRRRAAPVWDAPLGKPDDDQGLGCDRLTSSVHSVRLTAPERRRLYRLKALHGTETAAVREALVVLEAVEIGRGRLAPEQEPTP